MKKILLALSAISTMALASGEAEVNVNDTDLELSFKFDVNKVVQEQNFSSRQNLFGFKIIKAEQNTDAALDYDPDYYAEFNYLMMQDIGTDGLRAGIGTKFNYTKDFSSIPFGLEAEYKIKNIPNLPIKFGASIYYAPQVLTFADGESYLESRANVAFEILRDAQLVVGYRNIQTNLQVADVKFNEAAHFGVRMKF